MDKTNENSTETSNETSSRTSTEKTNDTSEEMLDADDRVCQFDEKAYKEKQPITSRS